MMLILHIAKKDFRRTWLVLAATLALFLIAAWSTAAPRQQQADLFGFRQFADVLVASAWMICCGVLWQQESLPGQRAYWFARPLRWQELLQAKTLVVAVAIFLPILATHAVIVSANGFTVAAHLPALAGNALLIIALYVLPIAVLAAITRNLQQLILWVLGISVAGIVASLLLPRNDYVYPIANAAVNAITIVALLAVLIWQYRTRNTRAGRIIVVALTLFLRALPAFVPDSGWYALRRAVSAPHAVQLAVRSEQVSVDTEVKAASRPSVRIPVTVEGLAPGQTVAFMGFHDMTVTAGGEKTSELFLQGPPMAEDISVLLQKDFAQRHPNQPLDVSILAELTVYDAPRTYSVAVGESIDLPEFGRCLTMSDGSLGIQCHTVLGSAYRVDGRWAVKEATRKSPLVLHSPENPSPLEARLFPIAGVRGGHYAQSVYSNGRIFISMRKPIAHVQRRIDLHGIR